MDSKLGNKRKEILRGMIVSYNELMSILSDDTCIKVSCVYFNYMIAKTQYMNIRDKKVWELFDKYLQIDSMEYYISRVISEIPRYYLISVSDIKYIIKTIKCIPNMDAVFLKSDITPLELEELHNNIIEKYNKMDNNNLKGYNQDNINIVRKYIKK